MFLQRVFGKNDGNTARIPSIVATHGGLVCAFANNRIGSARDDVPESELLASVRLADGTWSSPRVIAAHSDWSYIIGSAVADDVAGKVMCLFSKVAVHENEFVKKYSPEERFALAAEKEKRDGIKEGFYVMETTDGINFTERRISVTPPSGRVDNWDYFSVVGSTHGSSAGITLRYGNHAGRLLLPARFSLLPVTEPALLKTGATNTVIWSDDHGETFFTGGAVEPGTAEGAVAELPDGRIYYNSRAYFGDGMRRCAWSDDCGKTFFGQRSVPDLIEPCCNGSLTSFFWRGRYVMLFSNPKSTTERRYMTLSISLDFGESWQTLLKLDDRPAAYSCLAVDEKNERLYLLFECGTGNCYEEIDVAEFSLSELLDSLLD